MDHISQNDGETEKKLQELATHLQSLLTSLGDIVFEIDGTQTFKNVWVHDETVLFMPKEKFLGKKIADVMGPLAALLTKAVDDVIRTGKAGEVVYKHIDSAVNKWYKVRIRPVVKASELKNYVLVLSIQDITPQRLAKLALQETKEKLELSNQLLDFSQELSKTAGWEFNLQTGAVFWTRQAYRLFDKKEDFEPSIESTLAFFKDSDRKIIDKCNEEAITQKKPYDLELRIVTGKGANKWVRAIGAPVMKDNEVVMIRGALMDITLKKENELELIKARNEAENASRTKSDFLSIMSHEIRTPLNGIIGIANLLKLNHTIDQEEHIRNLIFSADHLMELINDILDFTKIENDKLELTLVEVDLFQLIKNIKNQFKSSATAKGIRLKSFLDDDVPQRIIADPVRLGQILNNLISNAIKFTDKGEVALLIKLLSVKGGKALIHFVVKDTGIGIPEELQGSIFESFKQVQQSAYRKHSGTGLGLTITQKLVELHNSRIFLKSRPGVGSQFYFDLAFDLPSDQNQPGYLTVSAELASYRQKLTGLQVLLVEDNPINIMVAQKQLEYFGVFPDCVRNGKEALELVKNNRYHAALLDLHMPEIDGYALAEIMRKEYPDIHLIIFTADIMAEVKMEFAKINVYDILNKPFAPEEMFEILLKVAQARGVITA